MFGVGFLLKRERNGKKRRVRREKTGFVAKRNILHSRHFLNGIVCGCFFFFHFCFQENAYANNVEYWKLLMIIGSHY